MPWGAATKEKKEEKEPDISEEDVLRYNINEVQNDTLESTRNMRRMCEESKDMGLKCMGSLENQGEMIEKWEEVADGINEDMKLAEKALKDMDRACFGMIPKFWKIGGGFKEDDAVWKEPEQPKNECLPEAVTMNKDHKFVATSEQTGEMNDKEIEMEENMEEVSAIIANLRNVANDMGNTIRAQNDALERIDKKQGSDIQRVGMAVQKAGELMGS